MKAAKTEMIKAMSAEDAAKLGVAPPAAAKTSGADIKSAKTEMLPSMSKEEAMKLAMQAAEAGEGAPVVLNAANEVAVAAFLAERLSFTGIADLVASALDEVPGSRCSTLEEVLALDRRAREASERRLMSLAASA